MFPSCNYELNDQCHYPFQVVVDAVCSVASEEIQMDAWGIDAVLTASQKGLGTPPGLSIVVASQKAIKVCEGPYHFVPF
jgi:aspartate aminotransferase-like enzyme